MRHLMTPEQEHLYFTSAWFRQAVDTLIPIMLQGLAAEAINQREDMEIRLNVARGSINR